MEEDHWNLRIKLVDILNEDCLINFEQMNKEPSDTNKRNYIRAIFAMYEAILSNLRESILDRILTRHEIKNSKLDIHAIYPLLDEKSTINESGKITKRPNQERFEYLVKYGIKLACTEYQITENLFSSGWDTFKESIKIRHRITHPKFEQEISISDADLRTIEQGRLWWNSTLKYIRENGKI